MHIIDMVYKKVLWNQIKKNKRTTANFLATNNEEL